MPARLAVGHVAIWEMPLAILIMLASNWDTKDARDGVDESNNGIIRAGSTANSPAGAIRCLESFVPASR